MPALSASRDRANALLNLATHLGWRGRVDEAEIHFHTASDLAQELGDCELTATIALAIHNLAQHEKTMDEDSARPYLQEAYATLHAGPSTNLEDVDTIAEAVTEALTRRAAVLDRLLRIAHTSRDPMLAHRVAALRWPTAIEVDDSSTLLRFLRRGDTRSVLPLPDRIALDFFLGFKDSAQSLLQPVLERHREQSTGTLDDEALMVAHLGWANALSENDLDEADSIVSFMAAAHPYTWIHQALTDLRRGDIHLAELHLNRDGGIPTTLKPLLYRMLAEAAITTQDVALHDAATAYLRPLEGTWLVSAFGADISGPVDLWLGRLARLQGAAEEARAYLDRAEASATAMTSLPWQLECRLELALLDHDLDRVDDAIIKAERLGLHALSTWAERATPTPQSHRLVFRPADVGWLIGYNARTATLPARKGLQDIHLLLTHAGTDISAYDLLIGPGAAGRQAPPASRAEQMIDAHARQEIGAEIKRLDERIEAALQAGADNAAQRIDKERDELLTYLGTATGLFNRARTLGDEAEKARKTVSSRIKHAIGLIETELPDLADHLNAQIVLGVRCRYLATDTHILDLT